MRNTTIAVLAAISTLAAPLSAQSDYNTRVIQAMAPAGKYVGPICPLPGGDFHTSSAGTYLKTATEGFKDKEIGQSQVNSKTYAEGLKKALRLRSMRLPRIPRTQRGMVLLRPRFACRSATFVLPIRRSRISRLCRPTAARPRSSRCARRRGWCSSLRAATS